MLSFAGEDEQRRREGEGGEGLEKGRGRERMISLLRGDGGEKRTEWSRVHASGRRNDRQAFSLGRRKRSSPEIYRFFDPYFWL